MIKFELDLPAQGNIIKRYSAEGIQINDTLITDVCLVGPSLLEIAPAIPTFSRLRTLAALEQWLTPAPDILIVGTGQRMRLLPPELYAGLMSRGIGVEAMDTFAACRCFNVLVAEQRNLLALLYPSTDSHLGE